MRDERDEIDNIFVSNEQDTKNETKMNNVLIETRAGADPVATKPEDRSETKLANPNAE